MSKEIEKRAEEKFRAYEMHMEGVSIRQICMKLDRNYRTVRKYIDEMESLAAQDFDPSKVKKKVTAEYLELIQHAKRRLSDPSLLATSTAGPMWAKSVMDSLDKLAKMHGVADPRQQTEIEAMGTLVDLARAMAEEVKNNATGEYLNQGVSPGEYVLDGHTPLGILGQDRKSILDEDTGEVVAELGEDGSIIYEAEVVEENT